MTDDANEHADVADGAEFDSVEDVVAPEGSVIEAAEAAIDRAIDAARRVAADAPSPDEAIVDAAAAVPVDHAADPLLRELQATGPEAGSVFRSDPSAVRAREDATEAKPTTLTTVTVPAPAAAAVEATTAAELDEQLAAEVERMAAPAGTTSSAVRAAETSQSKPETAGIEPPPASSAASEESEGSFEEVAPDDVAASPNPSGGENRAPSANHAGTPMEPAPADQHGTVAPAAAVATTSAPSPSPSPAIAPGASGAAADARLAVQPDESPFIRFFRALLEIISLPLALVPESKRRAVNWIALSLAAWAPIAWLLLLLVFK